MGPDHAAFLTRGYEMYLKEVESCALNPGAELLSYEFDFLKGRRWHSLGQLLVSSELQELTNLLNLWRQLLLRWHAWKKVLDKFEEPDSLELRLEFLESTIHECLLKPSSIRDTFTSVATNSLHQVRLSVEPCYKDFLYGDPTPEKPKPQPLQRRQKEKRLAELVSVWPENEGFLGALKQINTDEYTEETFDYRNLSSHGIGPRLGIGLTRLVTREVVAVEERVPETSGTFKLVTVPNKWVVQYGFGGTPPLNLENARITNLQQFEIARGCYVLYIELLRSLVLKIPLDKQADNIA